MGFLGDFFSGDWGNAFNVNEMKPGGGLYDFATGDWTNSGESIWGNDTYNAVVPSEAKSIATTVGSKEVALPVLGAIFGGPAGYAAGSLAAGALSNKSIPKSSPVGVGTAAPKYDETMLANFNAQLALADKLLAENQRLQPEWAKLSGDISSQLSRAQLGLQGELQPQASSIQAAYLNADRKNQISQLQGTLPQYQQAIQGLTPGYTQALTNAGQLAQSSMARANVAPQLTAFEGQVGSPYGPAVQRQAQPPMMPAQMPAAQQAMQGQMSFAQQGPPLPVAPTAAIPRSPGSAATLPPPPAAVPMGPPLPPGIQGPQAPSQEYLDASILKRQTAANQQATATRLAAEQQQFSQLPTLGQQQAWGQIPPSQQGPAPGQLSAQTSLQDVVAGQYAAAVPQFNAVSPLAQVGQTAAQAAQSAGMVPNAMNMAYARSAESAARSAGMVPDATNTRGIQGPRLQSGLENIDQGTVNQYVSTMPGMADYARKLSQISQQELAAGRGLTAEEERMAQQAARAGYAARGTALGGQSVAAEVLNRADVANQRFQQRLGTAAQAASGIQGVYQPALAQSLQRQQGGLQYGLEAQGQAFGQARDRDLLAQQTQAQRFNQAMGTQAAGFSQAQAKDTMAQATQAQRYLQATGTQATGYGQALGQGNYLKDAQQQAYTQAMGREALASSTQATAFNQALQRSEAEQRRLKAGTEIQAGQAQLGAGAMGLQKTAQGDLLNAYFQQPILSNAVNQAGTMGLANQAASGNTLFNPESPIGFQSAFLPYNANIAMQTAGMQADAAKAAGNSSMMASLIGAAGKVAASYYGVCWVAREVYGTKTGTWKVFRSWLLNEAPEWLVSAYIKHGPDIAQFIKNKPVLKSVIRRWMDSKIKFYLTA